MFRIIHAENALHYAQARALFSEYVASLDFDLDFQEFESELASLPGQYSPSTGCLLLAQCDNQFIGCVALRRFDDGICEMKRLYVVPGYRGEKVGRALAEKVINTARKLGYRRMRLDTVVSMSEANTLYGSLGFYPIEPYCYNPIDQARYYELQLR